jgi:hypothetical protein
MIDHHFDCWWIVLAFNANGFDHVLFRLVQSILKLIIKKFEDPITHNLCFTKNSFSWDTGKTFWKLSKIEESFYFNVMPKFGYAAVQVQRMLACTV